MSIGKTFSPHMLGPVEAALQWGDSLRDDYGGSQAFWLHVTLSNGKVVEGSAWPLNGGHILRLDTPEATFIDTRQVVAARVDPV